MIKPNVLHRGRFLSLVDLGGWEYTSRVNASGVVVIVAVTSTRQLVLVEQYRVPIGHNVIELPAGLVGDQQDPDEPLLQAARRELLEETGFEANCWEVLMSCPSSAGMSDEVITFVQARELRRINQGGGDCSEDITVHLINLDEVDAWIRQRQAAGTPVDPKIFSALYWIAKQPDDG